MRAEEEERRLGPFAGVVADQVADRIEPDLHAGRAHPAGEGFVQRPHRRAQEGARDPPRLLGEPRQGIAAGQDVGGGQVERVHDPAGLRVGQSNRQQAIVQLPPPAQPPAAGRPGHAQAA
jgi:hypothetical protein